MTDQLLPPLKVDPVLSKAQAAQSVVNMLHDVAERLADENNHDALTSIFRTLQAKPGVKTTEFWLASLLSGVGAVLSFVPGHEVQGGIMFSLGTTAYIFARTVVKKAEAQQGTAVTQTTTAKDASGTETITTKTS